ncbi:hypothetical protein HG531_000835 [Fusarium graminearum]|nr:hypothetical protein HG531_000835 [Fusarium graminearum]
MTASHVTSDVEVLSEPRVDLLGTGGVAPIPHQLANDGEQADNLDTSVAHAVVGNIADERSGGTGSLNVGPDRVACVTERQGEECGTDIGGDTSEDDLGLVGGLDSLLEFFAVPSVDLALTLDKGSLGVHLADLTHERTVGALGLLGYVVFIVWNKLTLISGSGQDDGHVESLANGSVGHRLVVVQSRVPIASQLVETLLDVDNEEKLYILAYSGGTVQEATYSIVLVKSLVLVSSLLGKGRSRQKAGGEDGSELHIVGFWREMDFLEVLNLLRWLFEPVE